MKTRLSLLSSGILLFSLTLLIALLAWKKDGVNAAEASPSAPDVHKLTAPSDGKPMLVAFVLTDGATRSISLVPGRCFKMRVAPTGWIIFICSLWVSRRIRFTPRAV
jgi:hypothetical protein